MATSETFSISAEQKQALQAVFAWLAEPNQQAFRLGGYAGTGKSTLLAIIRLLIKKKRPKWNVAFASFTGKATQVLAGKLRHHQAEFPKDSVSTLHSLLYAAILDKEGHIAGWRRKEKEKFPYQLLVIDEASMVTADIWKDVQRLGIPVLAVGDHGQLPPVNSTFALLAETDFVLTHIHRQVADSPILQVAALARNEGSIPIQRFGPGVEKFNSQDGEAQLLIDEYLQQVDRETLFLTGFNTSRIRLNGSARATRWLDPERPEVGDIVVCLKNDWNVGIFNGMTGRIAAISAARQEGDTVLSYEADIEDEQGKKLYSGLLAAEQFNLPETLKFTKKQQQEVGQLFDYGYCLTVHKAQGSQAKRVVLIEERSKHMSDEDWKRWLYTGVTRAEEELSIFGK